ncbi:MAG: CHASE domain protein [Methanoregulaceae archaeon PtaU1.Bin059]|nr:MAG: CHASE domain protein [Methanoregulaceae archaeon PtaB.Bin152]OPY40289.1 MAG: CHASE domain protein [Methanoregulaceae archaeon PtaU1.Bin059]
MHRYGNFFLLAVVTGLLLGAGCLQEQTAPIPPTPTPLSGHAAMQQVLGNMTAGVQSALDGLDFSASDAAGSLKTTGISGPDADAVLARAAASYPAVMNVITYDPDGTVLAAEPSDAKVLVGQSLIGYAIVQKALTERQPLMSELLMLAEGGDGVVIAHPVFSTDGKFAGVVSIAFSPDALVRPIAESAASQAPYSFMVAQPGGRILYDPDPEEVGRETFNETLYADFPEILDLARQYAAHRTGYDTYSFHRTGSGEVVSKETFWDTVELHGTEWRVFVTGEM